MSAYAELDAKIRARMSETGESYQNALEEIADEDIRQREREAIVVAIRMWARSYASVEAVEPVAFMERLAKRIEDGEYEC